mgnify:CR=1 FL=1
MSTIGYYPQRLAGNAVKIMVDIDEKELAKEDVPVTYKYHTDVKSFMTSLMEKLPNIISEEKQAWKAHCMEMRKQYPNVRTEYQQERPLNEYWVTEKISQKADAQANIVVEFIIGIYHIDTAAGRYDRRLYLTAQGFQFRNSLPAPDTVSGQNKRLLGLRYQLSQHIIVNGVLCLWSRCLKTFHLFGNLPILNINRNIQPHRAFSAAVW